MKQVSALWYNDLDFDAETLKDVYYCTEGYAGGNHLVVVCPSAVQGVRIRA